ncbi:hypothetical protein GC102_18555 [Paenibacillus sp. LMG 31460]|uniref:Uncharacterized protein n=1 Tax=Paenibacillus germinis TaxID=2654979 RepID=A0ABX1Z5Z7_9BACL|nr:hypothetical protein [Paenibacillus germinis]NOU87759.1 hypothetical protein [Paenibacillus germinis]
MKYRICKLLPRIAVANEIGKGQLIGIPFAHSESKFYTHLTFSKQKWMAVEGASGFVELLGGHISK